MSPDEGHPELIRGVADREEPAVVAMMEELREAGVDTAEFALFTRLRPTTFDHARAVPILLRWLPQIENTRTREAIARSLTGEPEARRLGAATILV